MADQPAKKRRVKNPETFRERASKAATESSRPKRRGFVNRGLAASWRPISKGLRAIFQVPPFKWLRRPLRLIGKVVFPAYLRNSWQELRLVTWPNWRESRRLTSAVLVFAIIFGAAIALVDYGLDKLFKAILLK